MLSHDGFKTVAVRVGHVDASGRAAGGSSQVSTSERSPAQ
jgi:hypothetical protein